MTTELLRIVSGGKPSPHSASVHAHAGRDLTFQAHQCATRRRDVGISYEIGGQRGRKEGRRSDAETPCQRKDSLTRGCESGRLDLNQRPPAPEAGALPGYATPRSSCTCAAGAPGRTRTSNLLIRSQMLYPIELRAPSNHVRRNAKRRNTTRRGAARRRWQVAEPIQGQQLRQGRRAAPTPASAPVSAIGLAASDPRSPSLDEPTVAELTEPPSALFRALGGGSSGSVNVKRDPVPR